MPISPVLRILNVGKFLDRRNLGNGILLKLVRLQVVGCHGTQGSDADQQSRAEGSSGKKISQKHLEKSPFFARKVDWPMQAL